MDISGALLKHAIRNTWAKPHIDLQYLIEPNRLTATSGVRGIFRTPFKSYSTPDSAVKWVLYDVGHVPPNALGLDSSLLSWQCMEDLVERDTLFIDAMFDKLHVPLKYIYVIREDDGALVFALKREQLLAFIKRDAKFTIRLYSNHYFNTPPGQVLPGLKAGGLYMGSTADISQVFVDFNALGIVGGATWWYHNGYYGDRPSVGDVSIGDTVSWIWDSSATRYFDIRLKDLGNFTSTKDAINKFLLILPEGVAEDFIFYDDVEFYICSTNDDGHMKGVYYDRRSLSDLRQATLMDWAIDSTRVYRLLSEHSEQLPVGDAFFRVFLRKGTAPSLVLGDGQYLKDLYRLDYSSRYHILRGEVGTPQQWQAQVIENSAYMEWLGLRGTELNESRLAGVFNYYGLQAIAQRPIKGEGSWVLPEMASDGCIVAEMDDIGRLIGFVTLTSNAFNSNYYGVNGPTDILVYCGEVVANASVLDITSSRENDTPDDFEQDRYYQVSDSSDWVIGTEGVDYTFNASTGLFNWSASRYTANKLKRSSRHMVVGHKTIQRSDLTDKIHIFDGSIPLTGFGFGRVDVWINKKRGVEGIDFIFDGLNLTPLSLEYANTAATEIDYIAYGLPSDTVSELCGFVYEGMVNYNDVVDLVNHRNYDLSINGLYRTEKDIWLAEDYRGKVDFVFTSTEAREWLEGETYEEGEVVTVSSAHYVAPASITVSSTFDASAWIRLWCSLPYHKVDTADTHVLLYIDAMTIKERIIYQDGAEVEDAESTVIEIGTTYAISPGLPLPNQPRNGAPFGFVPPPRQVPSRVANALTAGEADAIETTLDLSGYIGELRETFYLPEVLVLPKRHAIVSPFMCALVKACINGTLAVNGNEMSNAAVEYAVKDHLYLLEKDPMARDTTDKRFLNGYCHSYQTQVVLSIHYVDFLIKVNTLYFEDALNISRDIVIDA